MRQVKKIVSSDDVGALICDALGLSPTVVKRISFDIRAGDIGPLDITVEVLASDGFEHIDWADITKGASVTVAQEVTT